MKPKPLVILEALLDGTTIQLHDKYKYCLSEDNSLCIVGTKLAEGREPEECLLSVDISLTGFINLCNKMGDDEVFLIGANNVLSKKRSRR